MRITEKRLRRIVRDVLLESDDQRFNYVSDNNLKQGLMSYDANFAGNKGDLDKFIKEMYNSKFGEIEIFIKDLGPGYLHLTKDKNLASAIKLADIHICKQKLLPHLLDMLGR